eukprot:TRINITY_DN1677_c0_g1_i1.p2 TRINITY_DN1677_c0_g1~~TRINITY_DN1677_c0_g1_i1.p2  ORF type:complete len:188 (-),score=81.33 TRINITY_DN1677_c0_g1_i1:34-597(-)
MGDRKPFVKKKFVPLEKRIVAHEEKKIKNKYNHLLNQQTKQVKPNPNSIYDQIFNSEEPPVNTESGTGLEAVKDEFFDSISKKRKRNNQTQQETPPTQPPPQPKDKEEPPQKLKKQEKHDPFYKAKQEYQKKLKEQQERREIMEQKRIQQEQNHKKRQQAKKRFNKKTRTGQPVMSSYVQDVLKKLS